MAGTAMEQNKAGGAAGGQVDVCEGCSSKGCFRAHSVKGEVLTDAVTNWNLEHVSPHLWASVSLSVK